MTQVIYEKERSCLLCGAYKASDGWDYAKQMCECGFGKLPTAEEIENDDYSTHQVQNLRRELEAAERREFKERDTRKGLELELTHRYEQIESLTQQNAELEEQLTSMREFHRKVRDAYYAPPMEAAPMTARDHEQVSKAVCLALAAQEVSDEVRAR